MKSGIPENRWLRDVSHIGSFVMWYRTVHTRCKSERISETKQGRGYSLSRQLQTPSASQGGRVVLHVIANPLLDRGSELFPGHCHRRFFILGNAVESSSRSSVPLPSSISRILLRIGRCISWSSALYWNDLQIRP